MKPKFRVTGARIAPLGSEEHVLDAMDLWVADGRIVAIDPRGAAPPFDARPRASYSVMGRAGGRATLSWWASLAR